MTAFLEKVARGIEPSAWEDANYTGNFRIHRQNRDKASALARARAAVEAMREPSEEMVDAGEQIAVQPFVPAGQFTTLTWQAMVNAALSEQQP